MPYMPGDNRTPEQRRTKALRKARHLAQIAMGFRRNVDDIDYRVMIEAFLDLVSEDLRNRSQADIGQQNAQRQAARAGRKAAA